MENIATDILQKHKIHFHFVVDNSQCLGISPKFHYKGLNKNDQFFFFNYFY
jgi:hypothetical protein